MSRRKKRNVTVLSERNKILEEKVIALEANKDNVSREKLSEIKNYMKRSMSAKMLHYESGGQGRWDNDWTSSSATPYSDIKSSLNKTIGRSRRLVDNCGFAQGAVNTIVDNIVADGIRPIPLVKSANGEPNDQINKDLGDAWSIFNDQWDRSGHSTFYENQRQALSTIITCGSIITNQVRSRPGSYLPVAYQMREPDRLDSFKDQTSKSTQENKLQRQIVHGIEINEFDEPINYWFKGVDTPISSEFITHCFKRKRPEQYTGMPWFAPVLKRLWDVQNLVEDKAIQSRIQTMIALWFEGDSGLPGIGAQDSTDDAFQWYPGAVGRGAIGSKPSIIQADDTIKDSFMPLVKFLLREIAVAVGLSYYSLARDIEDMNFAGSRAVIMDERRGYAGPIKWFSKEYNQPHYNEFVKWCAITGKVKGLTIDRFMRNQHKYTQCFWVHKAWDWVDPLKDVKALTALKEAGWYTDQMYLASKGIGIEDFYSQLKKEKKLKEKLEETDNSKDDSVDKPIKNIQTQLPLTLARTGNVI